MKLFRRILTSAIALGMAVQSVPAVISYAEDEMDFRTFSVLYDPEDDDYYLGINLGRHIDELPTEYNGKKIDKLDLEHIHFSYMLASGTLELNIPDGFRIVNKHWKGAVTGIAEITFIYSSGETEVLRSDDYDELVEYTKNALRESGSDEDYIEAYYKEYMLTCLSYHPDHQNTNYPYEEGDENEDYEMRILNRDSGIIRWFYNGDNDYIDLKINKKSYEVKLPSEVNGQKIEKLSLKDLDFNNNIVLEKPPVIIVPDGMEVVDKNWKNYYTGIKAMYLVYPSGEKEGLTADDLLYDSFSYLYDPDGDDYYLGVSLSWDSYNSLPTEYNGKKVDKIDLEHVYYVGAYYPEDGYSLVIPEGFEVVNKHWKGAVTGVAKIELIYSSGEKEVLKADDYDELIEYTKKALKKDGVRDWQTKESYEVYFADYLHDHPDHKNMKYPLENIDNYYSDARRNDGYTLRKYIIDNDLYLYKDTEGVPMSRMAYGGNTRKLNVYSDLGDDELLSLNYSYAGKINHDIFSSTCRINSIVFKDRVEIDNIGIKNVLRLKELTFESSAELGYYAFWGCKDLSNLNIDVTNSVCGMAFDMCSNLRKINNESPFNEDGSPKPEYKEFIEKNFTNADDIGFLNDYVTYRVKQAVSEAITDDMPDIVKVKALHDKLCSMTTYDTNNVDDAKNHVDVSVFLNDSTVCEGYARAMNLMLHEAGIESCFVDTDDHAWVIVKLGDHYFHVDPTWDDGDTIKYDWFMKSDSQIDGKDSHTNWELRCPSTMHSFQWKEMPQCTDIMGDVDDNDIIDGRDASAILTSYARTSVGGKEEVDSILADFNYDGIIDGRDASAVLTNYAKSSVNN